jgi:predicted dehydrogenase
MLRIIEGSGSRLMVNHERRYALDYVHARDVVASGLYGELRSIRGALFMGERRTPRDTLLHDGTHMLDIVRFLTGGDVSSIACRGEPETSGALILISYRCGGAPIYLEVGGGRDHLVFELDLSFERGRIRVGNGLYEEFVSDASPLYADMRSLRPVELSFPKTEYFKRMIEDAVRVVRTGSEPVSSGSDALAVMEAIYAAIKRARSPLSPFRSRRL